jgi:hypothetical protein
LTPKIDSSADPRSVAGDAPLPTIRSIIPSPWSIAPWSFPFPAAAAAAAAGDDTKERPFRNFLGGFGTLYVLEEDELQQVESETLLFSTW